MPKAETSKEFDNKKAYKGGAVGFIALRAPRSSRPKLTHVVAGKVVRSDSTADRSRLEQGASKKQSLESLERQTQYWHGTGRFQYRDGKVLDVLQAIVDDGGLRPHEDDIDVVGKMESLSLAKSRIYARTYADLHAHRAKGERHGSTLLWAAAFIAPLALKLAKDEKVWRTDNRRKLNKHFASSNSAQWHQKVRQEPTGTLGVFARGSDIEGNYPIVFGIKEGAVTPARTSESVAVHEVRSTEPISFNDLTHIEVPESKVQETQTMLTEAGYELPVMAIEDFEALAATKPFRELVA